MVSTQARPHSVSNSRQLTEQIPPEQTSSGAQRLSHSPQFTGSLVTSTHDPLHASCPGPQRHSPDSQTCPVSQPRPHSPQLRRSLAKSVQPSPQSVCSAKHDCVTGGSAELASAAAPVEVASSLSLSPLAAPGGCCWGGGVTGPAEPAGGGSNEALGGAMTLPPAGSVGPGAGMVAPGSGTTALGTDAGVRPVNPVTSEETTSGSVQAMTSAQASTALANERHHVC